MQSLRQDAQTIIDEALLAVQPGRAVREALAGLKLRPEGRLLVVSIGKAAWAMAKAAVEALGEEIWKGIIITKYGHSREPINKFLIREAGHPVPDAAGYRATDEALDMVSNLAPQDTVLLLISGGGSALFEKPLIAPEELAVITERLLLGGADIREINTIRKRLSAVKGGRFARACEPARIYSVVLSDIIGDPLDMIASGPAYPDSSTCEDAIRIARKYALKLSESANALLQRETPAHLPHVTTHIGGSVRQLCASAEKTAIALGYKPQILTCSLDCEAREAGAFLGAMARYHQDSTDSLAFIAGGETVVHVQGGGKGGRNQELALAASLHLDGMRDTALFSLGSDGTDGPTDAAGGYVDGESAQAMRAAGFCPEKSLAENDSYPALRAADGLLMTGPTGTNVNDLTVLLIRR